MQDLIDYINLFQKLDPQTENAVRSLFIEESYKKNAFILREGEVCTRAMYIKSGLIRRYYMQNEHEVTIWIYGPNQMATSTPSFFWQKPAYEYIQACEDTVIYSLFYEDEQVLLKDFPLFAAFHLKQLRVYLAGVDEVNYRMRIMSAKEKYQFLLSNYPYIVRNAKLKHIASFLDVSPETLSRIRASIS